MDLIKKRYLHLLKQIKTDYIRPLYHEISWNSRLVGIKGARGVGKTTMLLQRILLEFPDRDKAMYVSLDDIWFASHTLLDLADAAAEKGISHLFIDEVHKLRGWQRQIKNVYDFYPEMYIVFTGSSLLEIDQSISDLSRRCLMYSLPGLSFREYLTLEGRRGLQPYTLQDILYDHLNITADINQGGDMTDKFHRYLSHGYYPFYKKERESDYLIRVNNMITAVIDSDIPAVENIEYATLQKAKQLLTIMASQSPSPLNAKLTAEMLGVSTNLMIKLLSLLDRSQILRLLYFKTERNPKSMAKPQKVLLNNPSILHALGYPNKGKDRESFLASMLSKDHELGYPKEGDLLVDNRYLFEVGGARKSFQQIKDIPDSFVAADEIEFGIGNKIPLWLFGFLY